MLNKIPEFVEYYADDAAKEPIVVGDSAPATLADASRKTGRAKQDFEVRRINRTAFETLKRFFD